MVSEYIFFAKHLLQATWNILRQKLLIVDNFLNCIDFKYSIHFDKFYSDAWLSLIRLHEKVYNAKIIRENGVDHFQHINNMTIFYDSILPPKIKRVMILGRFSFHAASCRFKLLGGTGKADKTRQQSGSRAAKKWMRSNRAFRSKDKRVVTTVE